MCLLNDEGVLNMFFGAHKITQTPFHNLCGCCPCTGSMTSPLPDLPQRQRKIADDAQSRDRTPELGSGDVFYDASDAEELEARHEPVPYNAPAEPKPRNVPDEPVPHNGPSEHVSHTAPSEPVPYRVPPQPVHNEAPAQLPRPVQHRAPSQHVQQAHYEERVHGNGKPQKKK